MKNISEIDKRKYVGYVWMSDEKTPKVLYGEEEYDFSSIATQNPFVIEALLWSEDEKVSVHVRHTGKYHIHEYELNELSKIDGVALVEKSFLPHRLDKVERVKFMQLWLPESDEIWLPKSDENCIKIPVLTMKALIFTGFELKSN